MASLAELQDALQNAHAAGDEQSATALANEIVRLRPMLSPTPQASPPPPIPEGPLSYLPRPMQAGIVGTGRTLDKLRAGADQTMLSGIVAGKQLFGMDNAAELKNLARLAQEQGGNDTAYQGLRQQFPLSTGIGEAIPAALTPMGQTTAAARFMAPALGFGGIEGAQYGSLPQRAMNAAQGFAGGLAGGVGGELASRLIQPLRSTISGPAQDVAIAAAKKINAPLLPSQLTGSPTMARVEDSLARAPFSAGPLQDFMGRQQSAVGKAVAGAMGAPGDSVPQAIINEAKARMGNQYDALRAQIPNGTPASQQLFDAIDRAEKMLSAGSTTTQGKPEALGMLKELKDKLYSTKALTPEEYSGWVSDLSAAARSSSNQTIKAALRQVGGAMDQVTRGPLNPEWQKLDQMYAAARTLEKSGAYNPTTGDIMPGRLAGYMQRNPSGANATSMADAAAFARAVPALRAGSPTFERGEAGSFSGLLNAPWRYPLAKMITSPAMSDYLSRGLFANPEVSGLLAAGARKGAIPFASAPAMGLLAPFLLSQ